MTPTPQDDPGPSNGIGPVPGPTPHVVGHRGAAAVSPENTLASFRRALADGADVLEFDVHLTADGQDAIIHDATIDRTAQADSPLRTGSVAHLTREQLDRVLVGEGEHIPTLEQVLDVAGGVPVLVEIKALAVTDRVVDILRRRRPDARVISFQVDVLRRVRELAPGLAVGVVVSEAGADTFDLVRELGAASLGVYIGDARTVDVERCLEAGVELNLWTARSDVELERALELGCDSITVDDPAWARGLMTELRGPDADGAEEGVVSRAQTGYPAQSGIPRGTQSRPHDAERTGTRR